MKLEVFEKIVKLIDEQQQKSHQLFKLGVDLMNYDSAYVDALTLMLRVYYGVEGEDLISWYIYERVGLNGEINKAWDKNKNEICYDIPSLWKRVEELRVADDFEEYSLEEPKKLGVEETLELFRRMFGSSGRL